MKLINPHSQQARGLVACYPLSDGGAGAFDVSATKNHGLLVNGAAYTGGRRGTSLYVASGGRVSAPDHTALNLTAGVTLSVLVTPQYTGGYQLLIGRIISINSRFYAVFIPGDLSTLYIHYSGAYVGTVSPSESIVLDKEIRITVSYRPGDLSVYYNDRRVHINTTVTGAISSGSGATLQIGSELGSYSAKGLISDARIYNRGLTKQEVEGIVADPNALYRLNKIPVFPSPASTVKTINGVPWAHIKTLNSLSRSGVKTINGV